MLTILPDNKYRGKTRRSITVISLYGIIWNEMETNKLSEYIYVSELQIIFESNAYLPLNFWLNADFQNLK